MDLVTPQEERSHGDKKAYHQQKQNVQLGAKEPNSRLHLQKPITRRELTICPLIYSLPCSTGESYVEDE